LRGDNDISAMLRTEKERALLAYLVVESGHTHTRENLAELLWPERVESVARTSLRQALLGVRRAIGDRDNTEPFLYTDDEKIQFTCNQPYRLDTEAFNTYFQRVYTHTHKNIETCLTCAQHLQEAVGLYRGDFMSDLLLSDSPGFQEWVIIYREQYFRYLLSALQILSDYFQNVGDFDLAQQYARRLVNLDPLDEATHQRLMYILAVSGKRAAALEQFQICRRTLKDELGAEPSGETLAIYDKIRKGEELPFKPSTGGLRRVSVPAQFTMFIGRESELSWLTESLNNPTQRLISLVGMGGIGKTRLALQVAESQVDLFPDGIRFISLENITSSDLLVPSIAQAVGLSFRGDSEPARQLVRFLRPLYALLIIDSVEHMLDQMPLFMTIMQQAPGIKLLLTSRWRLNYQAAAILELKGLPYPTDLHDPHTLEYPAVKLFINRAVHSQADFSFTEKDLPHIVQICRLVDGSPLALELAASRVRELSCEQIDIELQRNLGVLKTNMLDIPERHRSIHTTFDPYWESFSGMERLIYQRMSVFQDGFNLAAAEAITDATLPMLSKLLDRALLQGSASRGFFLPPLLKRYAAEKLAENPEERERILDLHSKYYVNYLDRGNASLHQGAGSRELVHEIDLQIDNIRAALTRASFRRQTASFTKGMDALQRFYELRNEHRQTHPLEARSSEAQQKQSTMGGAPRTIPFKPETRQLLDILIHSPNTEREIFLRELISNAANALASMDFERLNNRNVHDADVPLYIRITPDFEQNTLLIQDTGLGMTLAEITENLGFVARPGTKTYVEIAKNDGRTVADVMGQFGAGFYSAFMVAENIRVESRSFRVETHAAFWMSDGSDTFTVGPVRRIERGTSVMIKLRPDAVEFLQEDRLIDIIKRHIAFTPFPIYIGSSKTPVNHHNAIWRQSPREVTKDDYNAFYRQLTLDREAPLAHGLISVDAPVQLYALLYIPSKAERSLLEPRREDGLKLYARQVLIQEYCKDLLPAYLNFFQGVVDSEDLALDASRQIIQSERIMATIRKLVTNKALDLLIRLAANDPEAYVRFWQQFSRHIKEGVATEITDADKLHLLLRFHTISNMQSWISLDQYIAQKKVDQSAIYYILSENQRSVMYSPHLDVIRHYGYDALVLSDSIDVFMLTRLTKYQHLPLVNVANADLKMPEVISGPEAQPETSIVDEPHLRLIERFKTVLAERVTDVRITDRLSDSPARLVEPEGGPSQQLQRMYHLLRPDFVPPKKIIEINPHHPILVQLTALPDGSPLIPLVIQQVYENILLVEGLHPDPAGMIQRIQKLMEEALEK
jgi:molecular chaperone HtpG